MSSTRRAAPGEPLRQNRYSSSAAFDRGLLGNLVAARCKLIKKPEDRAVIYFLQQLSHQEGGLERVAEAVLEMFPERFCTPSMHRFGSKPGQRYNRDQMKLIAPELPLLPMDFVSWTTDEPPADAAELTRWCRSESGSLPNLLREICLDPLIDLETSTPLEVYVRHMKRSPAVWWFYDLWGALHEFRRRQISVARGRIVATSISQRISDDLDYAHYVKGLVIIEGQQRTGKSTSAENWCALHPGEAVYVKLESGMDDTTFFRSISRALGTACSLQRKTIDMRMRIEDMLQEGHLTLVCDEAHFLWPQVSRPRSAPSRIDWLRTALVDHGVSVALISTPQFEQRCELFEKALLWNSKQLKGRLKLHTVLPPELPEEDLAAVARHMVPDADEVTLLRLVGFAQISDDYLAGIERLVSRAGFFALRDGRDKGSAADIAKALDEAMPRQLAVDSQPVPAPKRRTGSVRAMPMQSGGKAVASTVATATEVHRQTNFFTSEEGSEVGTVNRLGTTESSQILA